jgi:hypothetical protein
MSIGCLPVLSLATYVEISLGSLEIRMVFSAAHSMAIHYPNSHVIQTCKVFAF